MTLKIRPFHQKDATIAQKLMQKLTAYHGDKPDCKASDFAARCASRNKLADCWLAFVDEKPAGFVVSYDWMTFIRGKAVRHIDLIFVEEKAGAGAALTKTLVKDGIKKNIGRMTVGAQTQNRMANKFYEKMGFTGNTLKSKRYAMDEAGLKNLLK